MQSVIDSFNERKEEIEEYYLALDRLYEDRNNFECAPKYFDDSFLKILKSNAILMIYNLVESTIMGAILKIYDSLFQQGITYKMVREEIQEIWFSFKFNEVYDKNAHFNSYRGKAKEIIDFVLADQILKLDRKATNISGNLDAQKIRNVCSDHGITINLDSQCRGGIILTDVKNERNNLAHGTVSFVECGRNYSIDDLTRIKDETEHFLENILVGIKDYYDNRLYLKVDENGMNLMQS
jgi:hypothetical protein